MRLFVKVTPLKVETSEPSADSQLMECPEDVEPDNILSFLSRVFGDIVDTAWTSTERHARLACGWIFAAATEHPESEILCVPLVAMDDGSQRSMFELQADQGAEFDELVRSCELGAYMTVELPHRAYQPAFDDKVGGNPSARTVSTGGAIAKAHDVRERQSFVATVAPARRRLPACLTRQRRW